MEASRRKSGLFYNVHRRAAERSEGCTAPFEGPMSKDSATLVRIILHSRGTLREVDGRQRCAGDSNTSHSSSLLLTLKSLN